jgi:hypothetical protein
MCQTICLLRDAAHIKPRADQGDSLALAKHRPEILNRFRFPSPFDLLAARLKPK